MVFLNLLHLKRNFINHQLQQCKCNSFQIKIVLFCFLMKEELMLAYLHCALLLGCFYNTFHPPPTGTMNNPPKMV